MDVFFHQYFDLDIISDNFSFVLDGFWLTIQLSLVSAALALVWGLVLALLRASPGRRCFPCEGQRSRTSTSCEGSRCCW